MRYFLRSFVVIFLFFSGVIFSETITFDGPNNTSIPTNYYNSQGVSSIVNGYFLIDTGVSGDPTVLQGDNIALPIVITFVNLQSQVSIDVVKPAGTAHMKAYDINDQLLQDLDISGIGTGQTITQNNIKYITITATTGFYSFDNLTFPTGLPVELTSFTGIVSGARINLNWHTATEVNNYGFDVERRASSLTTPGQGLGKNWFCRRKWKQ